ncbi:MAG: signal peptidase I [Maricaulaceae bacterium]
MSASVSAGAARKLVDLGWVLAGALAAAILARTFLVQPFFITSPSMAPILRPGDVVLVAKWAYGYRPASGFLIEHLFPQGLGRRSPARGDMVVVRSDAEGYFVKRVIGLPGDRVGMREGRVVLNGQTIGRISAGGFPWPDGFGEARWIPAFEERLPQGRAYVALDERADGRLDTVAETPVPQGRLFLMGDHRDRSDDSRARLGLVPMDAVVGRPLWLLRTDERPWLWLKPWAGSLDARLNASLETVPR